MIKQYPYQLVLALMCLCFFCMNFNAGAQGRLRILFTHTAGGQQIQLRDSTYTNAFGEQYVINKLKYYTGRFYLPSGNNGPLYFGDPYFLVNAANEGNVMEVKVPEGKYPYLGFMLGVDSIDNCSGAQDGALDPMNDMFWTWNSGYVFFKLEGFSDTSRADLHRIEHHIGGYKAGNNATAAIRLQAPDFPNGFINIEPGTNTCTVVVIEVNLDRYWKSNEEIRIHEMAVCMSPGAFAMKAAANFPAMFSIKEIYSVP